MAKWDVQVKETRYTTVQVEAGDWCEAREEAIKFYKTGAPPPEVVDITADPLRQRGEPWVRGPDPFYYKSGHPEGVLVFERAHGFVFTQAEVNLLIKRCREMGLKVVESWNGAGCKSLSIQCEDLSSLVDEAALRAPRVFPLD